MTFVKFLYSEVVMGFWSSLWDAAKSVGEGIVDVFVGIAAVLVLTVWAIGYVIFSIFEHLYSWIDQTIEKVKVKLSGVTMVPPEDTEKFVEEWNRTHPKSVLPKYKPGTKRSMMAASNINNKIVSAQIVSTTRGFEHAIEEAFRKGNLVEQPIENE